MGIRRSLTLVMLSLAVLAAGCREGAVGAEAAGGADRFPWVGSKLGITDGVPAPWKPLELQGSAVKYWGGAIDFGNTCLPSQITSQGVELLSRPVRLNIRVNGRLVTLQPGAGPQRGSASDASVTLTTSASTPQFMVHCDHTVEFDGMIRTDLVLAARKAIQINSVSLEVPLRGDVAAYFRRFVIYDFEQMKANRDDYIHAAGSTRRGWEIPFCPYVWLGRPDVGLEWFSESDEAWRPWGQPGALALKPGADEVVLEARMIRQPQALRAGETWEVTFGLTPTPSRPSVPNWRSYRWGGRRNGPPVEVDTKTHNVFAVFWISEAGGLALERAGLPYPASPDAFRTAKADLERRNIRYVPYGALFKLDTTIPEWAIYGSEWSGGRQLSPWKTKRQVTARPSSVNMSAESFHDFLVYTYVDAIRQYNIDGSYFDFGAPGLNAVSTSGPEGLLAQQGVYHTHLFALRELYKRLYVATKTEKPGFLTIASGMLPAMCTSFVDVFGGGEGVITVFRKGVARPGGRQRSADEDWYVPDYIAELPLDWVIGQFGRTQSAFPMFLPEVTKFRKPYWRDHPEEVEAYTRGMIALMAQADVHAIRLQNCKVDLLQQFSAAKAKFSPMGDDVSFHPFWRNQVKIEPAAPEVYATMYTLPDRALLIVSNLGPSPAGITVDPGLSDLGVTPTEGKATDPMTDGTIPLDSQGRASMTVGGEDFVMILME